MHRLIIPLAAMLFLIGAASACAAEPPNIIVLLADDLGVGDLGVTGQLARAEAGLPAIHTPNIDALAGESLRFSNMYAGGPFCSPSRATLLTGFNHAHITKERANGFHGLRSGVQDRTWGEILQDAGYATSMFGKWHLGGVENPGNPIGIGNFDAIPTQRGFSEVFGGMLGGYRPQSFWEDDGEGGLRLTPNEPDPSWTGPGAGRRFSEDVMTDRVVEMIEQRAEEPFAAYVAFKVPHDPFDAVELDPRYADEPWLDVHKQYASLITRMDEQVGRIIDALDDPNGDGDASDSIADETMVLFASDNGPLWTRQEPGFNTEFFDSNAIYNGHKSLTNEGGLRTPFFVRWTGVVEPGVNEEHVGQLADMLPTFADLVGEDAPVGIDGSSMLSAILDGESNQFDVSAWHAVSNFFNLDQAGWAVRVGDWKLIWRVHSQTYELFNLANDPSETANLVDERPDIVAALMTAADQEGVTEEPFYDDADETAINVYFTQYKNWSATTTVSDFNAAANWSGGTQHLRAEHEENGVEALYWNTGPAKNWIATLANPTNVAQRVNVSNDATVLGLEIRGDSAPLTAVVEDGVTLTARNGLRVGAGAHLRLDNSTIKSIRDVEIRPGGVVSGVGEITGEQNILAGIPELENQGLLEPRLVNSGLVDLGDPDQAGVMLIDGDYRQFSVGVLGVGLFSDGGAGEGFDQLHVTGAAELSGGLQVEFGDAFSPSLGDSFEIVIADGEITGAFDDAAAPSLGDELALTLVQTDLAVELLVVEQLTADFNGDDVVDGADLLILQRGFGADDATYAQGDATGDGSVDDADMSQWSSEFGRWQLAAPASQSPTPEPSTWALAIVSAVVTNASLLKKGIPSATRGKRSPSASYFVEKTVD